MTTHGYFSIPSSSSSSQSTTIPIGSHGSLTVDHTDDNEELSYSYRYGPPGVPGLLANKYALACAIFASIGGVSFGYDQGVIANVLVMPSFVFDFALSATQMGMVTAILELGALLGSLASGSLPVSRSKAIFLASTLALFGALLQALSPAHTLIYLTSGRLIAGLGIGALSTLAPLYISEIAAPEVRGALVSLEQLSIVSGVVLGFLAGYATRVWNGSIAWRAPLFFQLVPALVLGLGCAFLPASPRLLVQQGKIDEARQTLLRLRQCSANDDEDDGKAALVEIELMEMQTEALLIARSLALTSKPSASSFWDTELAGWSLLFSSRHRERTIIGVAIMFFQQWSGINALLYYGPALVRSIGIGVSSPSSPQATPEKDTDTASLLIAGGIGIVQLLAVLPAILVVDSLGRKPLLRFGSAVMAGAHLVIACMIVFFGGRWNDHAWAAWIAIAAIYTFTLAYGLSLGPIGWLLPAEIFPLSVRARGVSISVASNWANNFLIGLITPPLIALSPAGTFALFALACAGACVWAEVKVRETKGVGLEEMDAIFSGSSGGGGNEGGDGDGEREGEREMRRSVEREVGVRVYVLGIVRERGGGIEVEE